jgi:predicted Fe-Mo cluster-binding NifX family protein
MVVRGMGGRAINAFDSLGIQVIRGADGTLKEIIEKIMMNMLEDQNYQVKQKYHEQEE